MPSLYLTTPGSRLQVESGQLVVMQQDEELVAAPAARVDQVVVVGGCHVTTPALAFLLDRGVGLIFLTAAGRFRGRLTTDRATRITVRLAHYRRADDAAFCLRLSRAFVAGKIRNGRALLLRLDETNADPAILGAAADLRRLREAVPTAATREALLGIEGEAGRRYFDGLRMCLHDPWVLPKRARRPPPDPVNAVLSVMYTLLHERCYSALQAAALDPLCGFYHAPRDGRASLASDLMEEFRPVLADSAALTLLNTRMVARGDFTTTANGGVHLTPHGWRQVAIVFERRMAATVRPDGVKRAISYQKVLELQARRLRQVIDGDNDSYEPFRVR